MTKNERANTNGTTTQRIERDEVAVQTTAAHTRDASAENHVGARAETMSARAACEDDEAAWTALDDLVQRYEREDAEAAAAARRAWTEIAAEPEKQFREIVLSVARSFVAYGVDGHVVRHVSRNLDRLYKRRRARLQGAHEAIRAHEAREAMGELDAEEIGPVVSPRAHVGVPSSYPSVEDLAVGLER